eukprot:4891039-Pyramimonas_sp.AAC.1
MPDSGRSNEVEGVTHQGYDSRVGGGRQIPCQLALPRNDPRRHRMHPAARNCRSPNRNNINNIIEFRGYAFES